MISIATDKPMMYRRLCTLAAHRLANTLEYKRSQCKTEINRLNHECHQIHLHQPIMKRISEFYGELSYSYVVEEARYNSEQYKLNEAAIAQQQAILASLTGLPTVLTPDQLAAGQVEVNRYLEQNIQNHPLSNAEQHLFSFIGGLGEWQYLDSNYETTVEPQLQQLIFEDKTVASVTRNSYGVKCLNAFNVMFVDIDFDEFKPTPIGKVLATIKDVAASHDLKFNIYRTCNGFRLLELSRLWDALAMNLRLF